MKIADVRKNAFSMPLTSPSYPRGPYRFVNREFLIITYRTDPDALRAVVPEPLTLDEPLVKFEFIRMPDSTGFGDYTESGQVIPVKFNGVAGGYTHAMYLNDDAPIAGGREIWGRHAAHLRVGAVRAARRDRQGCVGGTGGAGAFSARPGPCGGVAGIGGDLGHAHRGRPDLGDGPRGSRLPERLTFRGATS